MYFDGRIETPDFSKVKKDMKELFDSRNRSIVLDLTELDEANSELDRVHQEYVTKIHELRNAKHQEIEEGYQRYLTKHEGEDGAEPVQEYDVTKSIVMQ